MNSDPHRDSTVHECVRLACSCMCVFVHACEHVCSLCLSVPPSVHDVHTNEGFSNTPLLSVVLLVPVCVCVHEKAGQIGRRGTGN